MFTASIPGSTKVLVDTALTNLFGSGFSVWSQKIPDEVALVDVMRHFDYSGIQYLPLQRQSVVSSNGKVMATVSVAFYRCQLCGKTYYQVEDIVI